MNELLDETVPSTLTSREWLQHVPVPFQRMETATHVCNEHLKRLIHDKDYI